MNDHVIICGFGSTGRSAATELINRGVDAADIVVVDVDPDSIRHAGTLGFVAIDGDATRNAVLEQAAIDRARAVVVAPNRDDTAVLITLTARELNPDVHIVTGGRERENLHLLRQGGADQVIESTAAVGRMLGMATEAPEAVRVLDDLLASGTGLELVSVEPVVDGDEVTMPPGCRLVSITRDGKRLPPSETRTEDLRAGDRLIVLRESVNGGA